MLNHVWIRMKGVGIYGKQICRFQFAEIIQIIGLRLYTCRGMHPDTCGI